MSDPTIIDNGGGWIAVLVGAILAIVAIFLLTSGFFERTGNGDIDVTGDMPKVDAPAPSAPTAPAAPAAPAGNGG
jgi:hypothetical protein